MIHFLASQGSSNDYDPLSMVKKSRFHTEPKNYSSMQYFEQNKNSTGRYNSERDFQDLRMGRGPVRNSSFYKQQYDHAERNSNFQGLYTMLHNI